MSFAVQAGSLVTASSLFLATTQFRNSPKKSLHPILSLVSASNWDSLNPSFNYSPLSPRRRVNTVSPVNNLMDGWLIKLGFGGRAASRSSGAIDTEGASISQVLDDNDPAPGQQFSQFDAGCFWGVELAFQRVPGVTKTEVGYTQGLTHKPTYEDVCSGNTMHSEVVRVQYDPKECSYQNLLDAFLARHDPTTLNRQGNDVGTQYRSGIYYYSPEQEKAARETMEKQQKVLNRKIVTEILPTKKFYRAEEYHQQYLAKGGRSGFKQSATKGCNDPIRCYG